MKIDLHLHTTFSDGNLTPEQVVELAYRRGIVAIGITDHDTVDGISFAVKAAENLNEIEVVPGIEINTFFEDQEIHILGYYIDYENHDLRRLLLGLQNQREQRTFRIVENLKHFGLGISYDDVVAKATGSSIGRPHIALALMEKGYVDSVEEAFDRFLSVGKPGYIPRDKMSPFEAIDLIKKHSGIPVLAHPGLLEHQLVIDSLLDHGLLGIEVYHISHTAEQIAHYTQLAKDRKLLFTGGSDSHDCRTIGAIEVPQTVLEKLKEAKSQLDNL